jgi:hypothetical protein
MTRGRPPKKGLGDATTVATARGTVMHILRDTEILCDFMIKGNDQLIFVNVRKALRLGGTREEMEREFREPIMRLRSFPTSANIIRELWTYSRRGIWRFFRIEQAGIVEICQDGTLLKNPFIEVVRTVREVHARKKGSPLVKGNG